MRVQVTGTMTKAIKERLKGCGVTLVKFTPDQYSTIVDYDLYRNSQDYDINTGLFKAIRISYDPDFYAMPTYLTTRELTTIFRNSDKTYDGFMESVKSYCCI